MQIFFGLQNTFLVKCESSAADEDNFDIVTETSADTSAANNESSASTADAEGGAVVHEGDL